MQTFSDRESGPTAADSLGTLFGSRLPMWFSTKQQPQFSLSKSVSSETETTTEHHHHVKFSESQYQEQDSSSTLSSGQSHHEAATSARNNFHIQSVTFQPGSLETHKKGGEDGLRPFLLYGNADYVGHQVQMEHHQSLGCISYPFAGSYFGRIATAYEPNAVVYPQLIGIAPERVSLPLDCAEGFPIHVNAKQYHAILRRRRTRAKLEAQNKVAKSRKPYLHESRHRHALKRARGSGGRFLNTKNMKQTNLPTQTNQKNLSLVQIESEPEIHHSGSTTSGSDGSCIFINNDIFRQSDFTSLTVGQHTGAHSRPEDRLLLSMDLYT